MIFSNKKILYDDTELDDLKIGGYLDFRGKLSKCKVSYQFIWNNISSLTFGGTNTKQKVAQNF
jgi:hypothetical protein